MALVFSHNAVRRALPKTWEFFRAISGLVAIVILAGVVTKIPQMTEPPAAQTFEGRELVPKAAETSRPARLPNASYVTSSTPILVFYLVASPEEEAAADWGEQVAATDAYNIGQPTGDRQYYILYARSEEEEQSAGRAMLAAVNGLVNPALIEVIDLRVSRLDDVSQPADHR